MTHAPTPSLRRKAAIWFGLAVVGVAAALGVAFLPERGPNALAEAPFAMSSVRLAAGQTLQVQSREVTVTQWNACHADGGCTLQLRMRDDAPDYPATGLSYVDAMEYVAWVNAKTGQTYRLPTAQEWYELAGPVLPKEPDPIFTDPELSWASSYITDSLKTGRKLQPSGAFSTTEDGISDLDGNVWEWTQDCYSDAAGDKCPAFVMGGEHRAVMSYLVRDPARGGCAVGAPPAHLGMRLVLAES